MDHDAPDLSWTETVEELVARRAQGVLKRLILALDQALPSVDVPPFPEDMDHRNLPIGTENHWLKEQATILTMLRARGVLTSVRDLGYANGFSIQGEESIVRATYQRLNDRLNPGRTSSARRAAAGRAVFIGHGGSPMWHQLQTFLEKQLRLPCIEFNSESAAGKATKERLEEMLGQAGFAFLVMTGEDVDQAGARHPRENVIHEAGLFQGRLGFARAIILLEDGCEEFSNIFGLVQIRFPRGDLRARFEDVRAVLEREGFVVSDGR